MKKEDKELPIEQIDSDLSKSEYTILLKKLIKFREKLGGIKKSAINPHFKSYYVDLESLLTEIEKPLIDVGLSYSQIVETRILDNQVVNVLVTTILDIETNYKISSEIALVTAQNTPQAIGSSLTYMRRYSLTTMLGLFGEPDDDGNAATFSKEKNSSIKKTGKPIRLDGNWKMKTSNGYTTLDVDKNNYLIIDKSIIKLLENEDGKFDIYIEEKKSKAGRPYTAVVAIEELK